MRHITLIIAVLALAIAAPAIAGKGGNGNGPTAAEVTGVVVAGNATRQPARVPSLATSSTATGLPNWTTDELHGHRRVRHDRDWVLGYARRRHVQCGRP